MKKILFTLVLLLTTIAAWAGTGDGSKEKPYTGNWWVTDLIDNLKAGDHLAYDCKILTPTNLSVTDERLNITVVTNCSTWSVGDDLIGDTPNEAYTTYCSFNAERENQTFIVTDYNFRGSRHTIKGYYSGSYTWYEAEGYINVTTTAELQSAIRNNIAAKVHIDADIDISGIGKIRDTFRGHITGEYDSVIPGTPGTTKASHILKGRYTEENTGDKKQLHLFDNVDGAIFEDIVFTNFLVHADDDNLGIIAKTASNSQFKNLVFESCSMFNNDDYVGVVAGTASTCNFDNVLMQKCDVTTDASYAGALVGKSDHCQFNTVMCGTMVYIFADGGGVNAYSGGISGYSVSDTFTNCLHMGLVGGNDNNVGGMAGYSEGSNFLSCSNSAMVVTCQEEKFGEIQDDREEALAKLDENTLKTELANYGVGIGTTVAADAVFTFIAYMIAWEKTNIFYQLVCIGWKLSLPSAAGIACVGYLTAAALIGLTVWYVYYACTGDDYAGGIVGCAYGGTIEQCSNFGLINATDKYVGGIAGSAFGVIINNCLNVGDVKHQRDNSFIDGYPRVGSIIGCGAVYNDIRTKITNCLSTISLHSNCRLENYRLDPASGNNYCVNLPEHDGELDFLETSVSQDILESGLVAVWLNNGWENRQQGVAPWRQNLQAEGGKTVDNTPMLDATHDEVTIADITTFTHITDATGLKAFAQRVNNGDQFACAVLDDDIVMPAGTEWAPIGCSDSKFRGVFDGQGHTISGLEVEINSEDQGAGLFGTIHSNAIIRNVILDNTCKITNNGVGGAAGIVGRFNTNWYWSEALIENCASYASVNALKHAGGILGRVMTGENNGPSVRVYVENCYNMGTITAGDGDSGLLCGYTKDHGYVSNCWSGGKLKMADPNYQYWPFSTVNDNNDRKIECLVGYNTKHHVENCYVVDPDVNVDHYNYRTDYALSLQDGVTVIEAAKLATGELTYMLNGNTNDVTKLLGWQQELGTDTIPVVGNMGVYHTRSISNTIGTACLPYALKSDDAIRYYTFSESSQVNGETKLNFDFAETVAPGTPVLFVAESTAEPLTFSGVGEGWAASPVAPASPTWNFTGTYEQCEFAGNDAKTIYYVSGGKIKNGKTATIKPYRAYFSGPSIETLTSNGSGARISIVIDGEEDETSALELVYDYENHNDNRSYTLFGTEAGEGYRGIVIRGGKKVIVNN